MSEESTGVETCTVCGKSADSNHDFTHLYHGGHRFPLCCPLCIQMFQRAPDRFASGERCKTLLDEMLDEMKWKDSGR